MLTLTERAATAIRRLTPGEDEIPLMRIGIQGGGCNGFEYVFDLEHAPASEDIHIEQHGIAVLVDPASAPYLRGAEIDFVDSLAESGLVVRNPNVVAACGCGASFQPAEGTNVAPPAA